MFRITLPIAYFLCSLLLLLTVAETSASSEDAWHGQQRTIDQLPHFEDFNGVETPNLPAGWTAIVKSENPNAFLETSTIGNPLSPPNHIRAFNSSDPEATLLLITPEIMHEVDDMRVRFHAHVNSGDNNVLEVGTIDLDGDEEFQLVESITLTNSYTDYMVSFDEYTGENTYIAFQALPDANFRSFYIDNVTLETIPTAGVAEVTPASHDFGAKQVNITWPPKDFTITNVGVADLTIDPADIAITEDDAADFLLHNLESTITLEPFESTTVGVSFNAQSLGEKSAILDVDGTEVPLSGEAFDATITDFPHFEDFNDANMPDLPHGWTDHVESFNVAARIETTDLGDPVSPPQQLRFLNMNDPDPLLLFISPPIDADANQLRIRFHARALSGSGNAVEVGTYNHEIEDGFTPLELITITTTHTEYEVDLDDYTGSDTHIAFRAVPEQSVRPVYFDNLEIDLIPGEAVIEIDPDNHEFPPTHYGEESTSQSFIISNTGGGSITIGPDDISLGGDDAAHFSLENISEPVTLETNDTVSVSVTFTPGTPGFMEATLQVTDAEAQLSGLSYDPTIVELPHTEDFNSVDAPELPFGWFAFVESTAANADVETSELGDPNSPPNHVRFRNFQDENAELILITAPIAHDLSELRLRFYSKSNIAGDHTMEVGTYNADTEVFTMLEDFDLTAEYTSFIFDMHAYDGNDDRIAFRANQAQAYRFIMLDDVVIEEIPDLAEILVTPDAHTFEPIQIGFTSAPKEFTIANDGGGTLFLSPDDIEISGNDAGDFILDNLDDDVELETGESTTIQVSFAPEVAGQKEATLIVDDVEVTLAGEAYDATITDFPWEEDFSGIPEDTIPFGWMRDTDNWRVANWDHAGGEIPELEFYFVPAHSGLTYLKSPILNTSDFDQMLLSLRHAINNYQDPGDYTLRLVTIAGEEEYLIEEWIDPDDMEAEHLEFALTAEDHGIGSENLQLAFVFHGESMDINRWSIDDIILRDMPDFYEISFFVFEDSPEEAPIEGAIINIAGIPSFTTDETGQASIELEHDTYDANIIKPGYVTQEITFTADQDKTLEIAMQDVIITPSDLHVTTEGLDPGQALFSWTMEEVWYEFRYDDGEVDNQLGFQEISLDHPRKEEVLMNRAFSGFDIYLDDMNTPFAEQVSEHEFLFEELDEGEYTAGVQAIYTTGESEMATIDFTIDDGFVMHYTATFEVQNQAGEPLENAVISVNGITGEPGEYVFDEMEVGTYDYVVSKEGYLDATGQFVIADEDVTVEVVMEADDVSVTDPDTDHIVVYPNPAADRLTIETGENIEKIRIFNLTGQVVYEATPSANIHTMDVSGMEGGVYLLEIHQGQKVSHHQISIYH